jgi:hypothetical protein
MSTPFTHGIPFRQMSGGEAALGHQSHSWLLLLDRLLACGERSLQRADLREIAADPHLLADLGLSRDEALTQADLPFWR